MSTGNELVTLKQVDNYYKDLRKRSAPVIFNSAVGNPVVFSDGADNLPIQSLKVHLLPRQEGTGDSSPENIRNFIPWNGIDIFGGGKNLLDISQYSSKYVSMTIDGATSSIVDSHVYADNSSRIKFSQVFCVGTYTIKGNISGEGCQGLRLLCSSQITGSIWNNSYGAYWKNFGSGDEITFTLEEPSTIGLVLLTGVATEPSTISNLQLEVGQTATAYEPYHPITETDIVFPSPVYGGSYEAVSGKLMLEFVPIDLSTMGFTYRSGWNCWVANADSRFETVVSNDTPTRALTAEAKAVVASNYVSSHPANTFAQNTGGAWFFDNGSTENPPSGILIIPLATPQEIQLTPEQLHSLLGNNTIWSDANGNIEVEYRADTGLFLKQNTVNDVQINGTSVLNDGVANIPIMSDTVLGVAKVSTGGANGIDMLNTGILRTRIASESIIKTGTDTYRPIAPGTQHISAFYALAKLAGADMSQSSNPVGQFTDEAKVAIKEMLGIYDAPFRFINEITVQEDCLYAGIDHDSYGLPFSLHEIIVKIITKQTDNFGNGGIVINGVSVENAAPFIVTNNSFRNDANHISYAHGKIDGGRFFGESGAQSMTSVWIPANLIRNPNAAGMVEVESITSIYYKSLNNYILKAGSIITLYGR